MEAPYTPITRVWDDAHTVGLIRKDEIVPLPQKLAALLARCAVEEFGLRVISTLDSVLEV